MGGVDLLKNSSTDLCVTSSIWLLYRVGYDTKNIQHRGAYTTFHYRILQRIWPRAPDYVYEYMYEYTHVHECTTKSLDFKKLRNDAVLI